MFCELCRVEFSSLNKKKSCKICGSVQCSSCLRFKLKKIKPVCLDCYYDKKSVNDPEEKLCSFASSSRAFIVASNLKPNKTNQKVRSRNDPKTDELVKRFENLKKNQVKAEDVSLLEHRFRQLKGLTEEKPASSENSSLSTTDQVSKLVERYIEEARIDSKCSVDFGLDDDPTEKENFPSCYMCDGVAEFSCRECDDNFCKRCFNKTHNKRERFEHQTEICK
ncbi:hypothetical protein MS3_00006119 [Schistosoma haematobium]|uniref:FYVE-type domain-containing protein n=1 Tax=Schistosoma haematobium TaxID=6185 RepID=A0A922IPP5_SCHHA|nr:hypothetical protein MS3_00006119 [Schistosoma haematobium]KAH9584559.1 hypothetical protein MS3_00006119 [Schistosoma haematobium]CAH8504846.1 unnamed protein product [Schistosoma haematobium]